MEVILLERITKLGQMGDVVTVKSGFARNFLLPQGKALRANAANKEVFEAQRADLEKRNDERKADAEKIKENLDGKSYILIRSAGQTGQLYGSVSTRDIAAILDENGFKVSKNQVSLSNPIKVIGVHGLEVILHPEVSAEISVNVARSEDEATRQEAGEDLTGRDDEQFEHEATDFGDDLDLSEVFENPDDVEGIEGVDSDDDAEAPVAEESEEDKA